MNSLQIQIVKSNTCYILDCHPDVEKNWEEADIPKRLRKKLKKAFDLIYEINQEVCEKEKQKSHK